MDPKYEVVYVRTESQLIDSRGNPCRYKTQDGLALARGYYAVIWPADVTEPLFDGQGRYFGPHHSLDRAKSAIHEFAREHQTLKPLLAVDSAQQLPQRAHAGGAR